MSRSYTLNKASNSLIHPLSLGAMLLLLLNDAIFRRFWPSWTTGKLGDCAWLFFFPFVILIILAWVTPERLHRHQNILAGVAFGLVAGVFTLAKTIPACHRLLLQVSEAILGRPVGWRLDPSDLIALPALLAAWVLWRQAPQLPSIRLRPAWLLVPLAWFLTVANSAQPHSRPLGITTLMAQDNQIIAYNFMIEVEGSLAASSVDGGITWQSWKGNEKAGSKVKTDSARDWVTIEDPSHSEIVLRYKEEADIEISRDGGQTWQVEYRCNAPSQAQRAYHDKISEGIFYLLPGPRSAVVDASTNNIVFNMGYQGVLIRKPDGQYQPRTVLTYSPNKITPDSILTLLMGELWLALIMGGLGVATLGLGWRPSRFKTIVLIVTWAAWLFVIFSLTPALTYESIATGIIDIALIGLSILTVPLALESFFRMGQGGYRLIVRAALILVGCVFLFLLPFLFWSQDILRNYTLAAVFGIALGAGLLAWQYLTIKKLPKETRGQIEAVLPESMPDSQVGLQEAVVQETVQIPPAERLAEEYAVYRAIFSGNRAKYIVLCNQTLAWEAGLNPGDYPTLDRTLIGDFNTQNKESMILSREFHLGKPVILLDQAEVEALINPSTDESGKARRSFQAEYRFAEGLDQLSRAGFNARINRALVYHGRKGGIQDDSRSLVRLAKDDKGEWAMVESIPIQLKYPG